VIPGRGCALLFEICPRRVLAKSLIALVVASLGGAVLAGGNATFVLGVRSLDEDDWDPIETQRLGGTTVDFGREGWPVHLAIGVYTSRNEDVVTEPGFGSVEIEGTLEELSFGVHKTFEPGRNVRPFLGGGVSSLTASLEIDALGERLEEDDRSFAIYGQGGVYWRIGSRFNLGLDVRMVTRSDMSIEGIEFDSDYTQVGLLLGWGWPGT